jgi:hypothetical protein
MLLGGGFTIGECGNISRCGRYEIFRAVSRALLCFGSRGGLLGPTPSENEVSGQFCLPVRSDLRPLLNCAMPLSQCRAVLIVWIQDLLHWDWLCGLLGPTPNENEVKG